MVKGIIKFLWAISKMIVAVLIWIISTAFISLAISEYQTEYYRPTDTPHERFMVDGQRWQNFIDNPKPLQIEAYGDCVDNCLKILDNGNYQYYNDSPFLMTYSEYQIKANQVIPISYQELNLGHMLTAMILAFLLLWLIGYSIQMYRLRFDKPARVGYHKKLLKHIALIAITLACMAAIIYLHRVE